MANEQDYFGRQGVLELRQPRKVPTTTPPAPTSEEDAVADLDEPPERRPVSRPALLDLQHQSASSFTKHTLTSDKKESLLTSALKSNSNTNSPVEEVPPKRTVRGLSCISTWSNNSGTTAELTSDGGFTSPGTRTSTPSPPLPSLMFHGIMPAGNKKPLAQPVSIVAHDDEPVASLHKSTPPNDEQKVEAVLGRKRCIMFACGGKKEEKKPVDATPKPTSAAPTEEAPKRPCTIKFACPSKISTDAPSKTKPRRMPSPAPPARRIPSSPKPKVHRDSDSTVRNGSPVSVRKVSAVDRTRRLSVNSDLAKCEKYRFHEFASSEEEVEEWTQEVTCHRSRLTIQDTLRIENGLRQLGEEVEEEALEEDDDDEDVDEDEDEDDDLDEDEDDESDAYSEATDEGFQTDDEGGFAGSDDESDAGSDYNWWAPGAGASTAATSIEHLDQLRLRMHRTASESSVGSLESREGVKAPEPTSFRRRKSKPVNIRVPSPELPDSTDFVCGTLDEDRPLEAAYMSTLERRRAAKHKITPQDIDPSFPASDPELPDDEEDEVSEAENLASESDFMLHGRMDPDADLRGRRKDLPKKRSPLGSPKRLRSPPPPCKRGVHRSPPPPRKLFGNSPKRFNSPPPMRLRSPPPTRRGSVIPQGGRQRSEMSIRYGGIGERHALTVSASVPRTPITMRNPFELELEDEDIGTEEAPVRRAIDIQVGLEKKRQRRRERLYRTQHRKNAKEKKHVPGRGAERMRELGIAAHAHKGKIIPFGPFQIARSPNPKDMHVLSV